MRSETIESCIGHRFADPALLELALTHRSAVARPGANNEKLEFLGDAVLDLAVSDLIMERWPSATEGILSRRRAALVNSRILARKATALELGEALRLGKGEQRSGGRRKASILAAALEAVLGAVFQDAGFEAARSVVARLFADEIEVAPDNTSDYKTRLQELAQKLYREIPCYSVVQASGPDHDKAFEIEITLVGRFPVRGTGKSKKAAEQDAARRLLADLEVSSSRPEDG